MYNCITVGTTKPYILEVLNCLSYTQLTSYDIIWIFLTITIMNYLNKRLIINNYLYIKAVFLSSVECVLMMLCSFFNLFVKFFSIFNTFTVISLKIVLVYHALVLVRCQFFCSFHYRT